MIFVFLVYLYVLEKLETNKKNFKMKLSKKELLELIKEEAIKIKQEMLQESDAVTSTEEPLNVKMNKNDGTGDSDKALVYKDTKKKEEKEGSKPAEVKLNAKDSDQGSDEDAAVAVEVEAGAKKTGKGHTAGQANANFTSKKDIQNTDASGPFDDRVSDSHDVEMNKEDKLVDEKAKTYVEAGAAKGGKTHTAGQAKDNVHERAPESQAKEPTERIAKGIEIDGSNINLKESYTRTELKAFITEQAERAVKSHLDEEAKTNRKEELIAQLKVIAEGLQECGVDMEMEEGIGKWLGTSEEAKKEKLEASLKQVVKAWASKGYALRDKVEDLMAQAQQDGYEGVWGIDKERKAIIYRPSDQVNWKGLQMSKGKGAFAGG